MIIGAMATYGGRVDLLKDAIGSILPQVDRLALYVNPPHAVFEDWILWEVFSIELNEDKVDIYFLDEDWKDCAKFRALHDYPEDCIIFVDDDLVYHKHVAYNMHKDLFMNYEFGCNVLAAGGREFNAENRCVSISSKVTAQKSRQNRAGDMDVPSVSLCMLSAKDFKGIEFDRKYIGYADFQLYEWMKERGLTCRLISTYDGYVAKLNKSAKDAEQLVSKLDKDLMFSFQ
jgi:hypothetical protein